MSYQSVVNSIRQLVNFLGIQRLDENTGYSRKLDVYLRILSEIHTSYDFVTPITPLNRGIDVTGRFIISEPFLIPINMIRTLKREFGFTPIPYLWNGGDTQIIIIHLGQMDSLRHVYLQLGEGYMPFKYAVNLVNNNRVAEIVWNGIKGRISTDVFKFGDITISISDDYAFYQKLLHCHELLRVHALSQNRKYTTPPLVPAKTRAINASQYHLISPEFLGRIVLGNKALWTIGNIFIDEKKFMSIVNTLGLINVPVAQWPISFIVPRYTGYWATTRAYIKLNTELDFSHQFITQSDKTIELTLRAPPVYPLSTSGGHIIELKGYNTRIEYTRNVYGNKWIATINNDSYTFEDENAVNIYKYILYLLSTKYNIVF